MLKQNKKKRKRGRVRIEGRKENEEERNIKKVGEVKSKEIRV